MKKPCASVLGNYNNDLLRLCQWELVRSDQLVLYGTGKKRIRDYLR